MLTSETSSVKCENQRGACCVSWVTESLLCPAPPAPSPSPASFHQRSQLSWPPPPCTLPQLVLSTSRQGTRPLPALPRYTMLHYHLILSQSPSVHLIHFARKIFASSTQHQTRNTMKLQISPHQVLQTSLHSPTTLRGVRDRRCQVAFQTSLLLLFLVDR